MFLLNVYYHNGKKEGEKITYYDDGKIRTKCTYEN